MKKTIAIILELLPIISAPLFYLLVISPYNSALIRGIIPAAVILAFFGFVFFFIGRKLAKESKAVRILGFFDLLATIFTIGFYAVAIFSFGL